MLNVQKGYDVDYYLDATAKGRETYYTDPAAVGSEPAGIWHGRGAAALGLSGEVDPQIMRALYTHGLDPRDPATADEQTWHHAARFGNAPRNYKSAEEIYAALLDAHPDAGPEERAELRVQAGRSARQSVAFYDNVLSASKSHTLLWVAAERGARDAAAAGDTDAAAEYGEIARILEEVLVEGHGAMLEFLAARAGYARKGHHGGGGGEWVDAPDWTSAQFLQHDSRAHDPQLHVHGTTLNKVVCPVDGKVRALDFSLILQWRDAAGAYGDRYVEALAWQRLAERGLHLQLEVATDGRSRQIAGIDVEETNLFSKRTAAITPALEGLVSRFRAETGRAPTNREHAGLSERAANITRAGKEFGGETRDGQLARWAAEYDTAFGANVATVTRQALGQAPAQAEMWSERDVVLRALAELEDSRQAWNRSNLMMAVSNALPGHLGIAAVHLEALLDGLTDRAEALAEHLNPRSGPQGLDRQFYRADGESTFVRPHSERYATPNQILGENELRAAAARRGAPAWDAADVDEVLARFARGGRVLSADQEAALRGILTSGAAVEVLNAPAGTGKSFLVGTLADTWPLTGRPLPNTRAGDPGSPGEGAPVGGGATGPGGAEPVDPTVGEGPRVFGLAYGQRQADVLTDEGVTARNIRRWLDGQARLENGRPTTEDETFRLRAGDLLVVDEAGAASTPDLVAIARRCAEAGVKLLLVGDRQQLAAVGAGGALADIAARTIEYQLAEVRRFHEPWEGPASLRLRDGDPTVIAEYVKHGRIVDAGTVEQAEQQAARAWLADTIEGRDALVIVGSNAAAARLSNQLRADLVRLGRVEEVGVPLGVGGARSEWRGTVAGVGDLVQARRNAWHLEGWSGNGEAPINRQTYRVTATHPTGGMTVARVTGRDDGGVEVLAGPILLPASYVREQVTLAYAATVHAVHGATSGAGYAVVGPGTDGPTCYVEATRGRGTNVLFVVTQHSHDQHETGQTARAQRRSAAEVVADIVRPPEVDPNRTALAEAEQAADDARATPAHLDPLATVVADLTAGRTQRWLDQLTAIGVLPEHHRIALAADDSRTVLDQLLRTVELAGHDPAQALADAVTSSSLDGSTSVAQVLHFRIRETHKHRLAPHIECYADLLPRHLPEHARTVLAELARAADERRAELGARLAAAPPQWAREALGAVPDPAVDPVGRAEWESKAGWAGSYRELVGHTDESDPLGPAPAPGLAEKHAVFRAAHQALDLAHVGEEEEAMSEGKLRARWAAWQRELNIAPRYVADELDATHDAHRRAQTDATIWQARADTETDPLLRDELATAAAVARERVADLAVQVAQLEYADQARTAFLEETAVTRDEAERARVAAGLKGIDLDSAADRVTAQEWFDAHLVEQLAAEAERAITEADLAEDRAPETGRDAHLDDPAPGRAPGVAADPDIDDHGTDGPPDRVHDDGEDRRGRADERSGSDRGARPVELPDTVAPDLRDTSTPDPSERADPARGRRVLPLDETAAAAERARRLLVEVAQRHEAEQAAAAHAAELEAEQEQLQAELARQAALGHANSDGRVDDQDDSGHEVDAGDVLDQAPR